MLSLAIFGYIKGINWKQIWYKISFMSVIVPFHIFDTENVKTSLAIFT